LNSKQYDKQATGKEEKYYFQVTHKLSKEEFPNDVNQKEI
jgi:hypothetical protein